MKKLIAGLLLLMLQQSIFAQVKISDMPTASGTCAGCLVPVLQSGINKKVSTTNLLAGTVAKTDSTTDAGYLPAWRSYTYWNGSSDNYNGTKTLYYHDGTLVDSLPKTPIVFDSYFIVNADSVFSALRASIGISILDSAGADGHTYKILRSSGTGGVAGILLSDLSALGPLSYNSSTGVFSADTSKANGKLATYTDIIRNRDSLLTLLAAKQNQINGTGFVKASGTTISYDNSTYITSETDPKRVVSAVFSGTTTKTLTLTLADASTITGNFTDSSGGAGGISGTTQTHTSGSTVTVSSGVDWLIVNPASLLSALTITMPASPTDRQEVTVSFGGTITGGNDVVTTLSVLANTGQTLVQNYAPTYVQSGESITWKYNLSTTKWYAK